MVKGSAEKAEPFILFIKYLVVTSFWKERLMVFMKKVLPNED